MQVAEASGISLQGKNSVVTGASSGIGIETAKALAHLGSHVTLACRNMEAAEKVAQAIREETKNEQVDCMELDLTGLESIRKFAEAYKATGRPLHFLILNAGIMMCPYSKTKDGFEIQMGTNHLGHFLLTNLLLEPLKSASPSRVVVVASGAHRYAIGGMNLAKLGNYGAEGSYFTMYAYGRSKLANILFAQELNKRMSQYGITAGSLHPGLVDTGLFKHDQTANTFLSFSKWLHLAKTPQQGAATTMYVALHPNAEKIGGKYFSDCAEASPWHCSDVQAPSKLWDLSEELVGLKGK